MGIDISRSEKLLWKGAPASGLQFGPQDLFAVPFSIIWLGAVSAISLMTVTGEAKNVDPMAYVMLPFLSQLDCTCWRVDFSSTYMRDDEPNMC